MESGCACGHCAGFKRHRVRFFLHGCRRCGCDACKHQGEPVLAVVSPLSKGKAKRRVRHAHVDVTEEVSVSGLGPLFGQLHHPVRSMVLALLPAAALCKLLQTSKAFLVAVSSESELWRERYLATPWANDADVSVELGASCCWRGRFVAKVRAEDEQTLATRLRQVECEREMGREGDVFGFLTFPKLRADLRLAPVEMEERAAALAEEHLDDLVKRDMWDKCYLTPAEKQNMTEYQAGRKVLNARRKAEAGPRTLEAMAETRRMFAELNALESVRECERNAVALFETRPWIDLRALAAQQRQLESEVVQLDERFTRERLELEEAQGRLVAQLGAPQQALLEREQILLAARDDEQLRRLEERAADPGGPDVTFAAAVVVAAIATAIYSALAGVAVLLLGAVLFAGGVWFFSRRARSEVARRKAELGIPLLVRAAAEARTDLKRERESIESEQRRLQAAYDARIREDAQTRINLSREADRCAAERQQLLARLSGPATLAGEVHARGLKLLSEARRGVVYERATGSVGNTVVYGLLVVMSLGLAALPEIQRRKQLRAYKREVDVAVAANRKARKRHAKT